MNHINNIKDFSNSKLIPFVHLRSHSEFSITDSTIKINDLIDKAKSFKQPAIAITDLHNFFGLVKFYKKARSIGIKPIAGCDIYLTDSIDSKNIYRLICLVQNYEGYLNLCNIITKSFIKMKEQNSNTPLILKEWLINRKGIIILSGGRFGDFGQAINAGNIDLAILKAKNWADLFPSNYYIELNRTSNPIDLNYTENALKIAKKLNLPVVATHPIQFLEKTDFQAHEVKVCISEGVSINNRNRLNIFSEDQYFYSTEEMVNLYEDVPSAIFNTIEIAKRCNLILPLGNPKLPNFHSIHGVELDEMLLNMSKNGLKQRLEKNPSYEKDQYDDRLKHECEMIIKMGFAGYFLIVQDFINWGKKNGVPVGPGRGSGAGSLVAYSLGITDIDPIRYDLLFERFLNPERVSMPDFDIDFCQENREKVIEYVKDKYGRESVSQIVTFGTFGAKAVIRDVGRALDFPYSFCDSLSKTIPFNPIDPWTLDRAIKQDYTFKNRYEKEEDVKYLIDIAKPLEGLTRNIGMHAGGVLIAPGKLTDFCPLYCPPGQDNIVSQFDKDDVEAAGLVKFDFLGLRNLTILDLAIKYVKKIDGKDKFDFSDINLNDEKTFKLLCEGNTTAVFQLESKGMKVLLRKLKPSNFEDIIAVLALYRPGPLESGMVDDFVNRKHGLDKVNYFHKDLENILKSTYGVIVYQEQVMLISQIIGGYSLGKADLLRRAMSKKNPEEMAKHRELFEMGAKRKGYSHNLAIKLFDLMEKFAGYGFNKSHSAAYAMIAYQTAWLKAHYPEEFMAATMSSDMDDTDKIQLFYRDAIFNNIKILPPDINQSVFKFKPIYYTENNMKETKYIMYGLGAIKGVGQNIIEEILKSRQKDGSFKDLIDFCRRLGKLANKRTIEALVKAGTFDSIEKNRALLFKQISIAMETANQEKKAINQQSLFNDITKKNFVIDNSEDECWSFHQKLSQEKQALGYCLSGHFFDSWSEEIRNIIPVNLLNIAPKNELQMVCGTVYNIRKVITKRGKMILVTIDDKSCQVDITLTNDLYDANKNHIIEDNLVIFKCRIFKEEYSDNVRFIAHDVYHLQYIRDNYLKSICINVFNHKKIDINNLKDIISNHKSDNNCKSIHIKYIDNINLFSCIVRIGKKWNVKVDDNFLLKMKKLVGNDNIKLVY